MQTIQLKTEEYQLSESTDNVFQLRPLPSQSSFLFDLQYNFASLYCLKTEKIIRTLPSISEEKSNSTLFHTEIDAQFKLKSPSLYQKKNIFESFKSMKNLGDIDKSIFVPKPLSHYCQICKETFPDYLQHINHSSHQKKLKEGAVTNKDFLQIQGILKKKNLYADKKQKNSQESVKQSKQSLAFCYENDMRMTKNDSQKLIQLDCKNGGMKNCETKIQHSKNLFEEEIDKNVCYLQKFGSKKRIIESNSGEHECMTIVSQKSLKEINESQKVKFEQKLISLKSIPDMNKDELNEFNFILN